LLDALRLESLEAAGDVVQLGVFGHGPLVEH
jgi:hypothetical protein